MPIVAAQAALQNAFVSSELWHRREAKNKSGMESEGLFDNFTFDLSMSPTAIVHEKRPNEKNVFFCFAPPLHCTHEKTV